MHIVIDSLVAQLMLVFFLLGWRKGALLSLLGIARVVLAYGAAYLAGRYLGYWLGETFHRPRIVMIPATAGMAFILVTFGFHLYMWNINDKRRQQKENEDDFRIPWHSRLFGGGLNLAAGLFSLILLLWLGNLVSTGLTGHLLPGSEKSLFGRFSQRAAYEAVYMAIAKEGRESQAAATARMVSNPEKGMDHLQDVLAADSVQQVLADREFAKDLLSGDPKRIGENASLQQLFNDRPTLERLEQLGLVSRKETKSGLCEKLSRFGSNENIRFSIENLQTRGLLRTDKILQLIRDPDFDVIVAEVVK